MAHSLRPTQFLVGVSYSFVATDFNGDGKADLVLADGGIAVCIGNGDGTFQTPVVYATPVDSLLQMGAATLMVTAFRILPQLAA